MATSKKTPKTASSKKSKTATSYNNTHFTLTVLFSLLAIVFLGMVIWRYM